MLAKYVGVRTCGTTVTRIMVMMILQAGYIREMLANIQFRIFNLVLIVISGPKRMRSCVISLAVCTHHLRCGQLIWLSSVQLQTFAF
jgi:hypothetical protein